MLDSLRSCELSELCPARRTEFRDVLFHAGGDAFDVGNVVPAKFHGVRTTGAALLPRAGGVACRGADSGCQRDKRNESGHVNGLRYFHRGT